MNIEKTCEPRQPNTVQSLQHLRVNLIHSWYLTTASVSCTGKLDKASSESSNLDAQFQVFLKVLLSLSNNITHQGQQLSC